MSTQRRIRLEKFSPLQQGLAVAVALAFAALIASTFYLFFALSGNWLTPAPRNVAERNIMAAQTRVREARADGGEAYLIAQLELVYAQLEAGHIDDALAGAEALAAEYPDAPQVLVTYAHMLYEVGRFDEASAQLNTARALLGSEPTEVLRAVYALQGRIAFDRGSFQEAYALFLNAAEIKPASAYYYVLAGDAAYREGRREAAEEAYRLARTYDPDIELTHPELIR